MVTFLPHMPCVGTPRLDCRDRLVVRTLRCGRSNPGSNPGHGMDKMFFINILFLDTAKDASAGNRTRINCLEGSYADHYTTDAYI